MKTCIKLSGANYVLLSVEAGKLAANNLPT